MRRLFSGRIRGCQVAASLVLTSSHSTATAAGSSAEEQKPQKPEGVSKISSSSPAGADSPSPSSAGASAADAASSSSNKNSSSGDDADNEEALKEYLIKELLSRDREVFDLKRINELGFMRVENEQYRKLKNQEDRGLYFEQNSNADTFTTLSTLSHGKRIVLHHAFDRNQIRKAKFAMWVMLAAVGWIQLTFNYALNDKMMYSSTAYSGDTMGLAKLQREVMDADPNRREMSLVEQRDAALFNEEEELRKQVRKLKEVQKKQAATAEA